MNYHLVLCTCPNEKTAKKIAYALVTDKLAACVNIVPGITSIYRWQETIETEIEVQLLIKSNNACFEQLTEKIHSFHPYTTPEIIALNIQQGDKAYLNWITESLK